jgi:CHASE2 domain-containing sensor protein
MVALAAQGKLPKKLAPMKTLLMPIFCHSPKEQEDFNRHFDDWINRVESVKHDKKQQLTFLQSVWQDTKQAVKNLKWFLIFASFALILLFVFPTSFDVEEPIGDLNQIPETPSQQTQTPIDLEGSPSTIPTEPNPNLSDETKPTDNIDYFTQLYKDLTWWQWAMLFLLPFGGLLWYLWQRYKAPPYLTRKSTSQTPNIKQFFAKDINEGLFQSVGLARVAQQLRKHTPITTDLLDLKATIKRTIKAGGWFTPVTGIAKTIPEYLVFIDRTTFKDHHSHFIDALVNQLIAQGVFVTRYYFDGDPRHCYPENDELPPLLLTELSDHYPTHRLLIFSDGKGFTDPITGDIVPWIEQFSAWTQKTFFTLEQPEQWGVQEKLLAAANFLVMPANENGLTTLAEQIKAEQWQPDTPYPKTKNFTAFPAYFNDFSQWWLERHAPDRAKVTELLKQVHDFLGNEGYYWFSACAVYPELRWQLTVYLGYNLKATDGNQLLTNDRLAKLARLPWFRYGYMPNWLRNQLIKDLPLPQENKIRAALETLLDEGSKKPISDFPLEIADLPKSIFSALKQWLSSKWKEQAPKNSLRDYVFLSFMENRLSVKAPKIARMLISKISLQPFFNLIYRVANRCKSFAIDLTTTISKTFNKFVQKIDWQRFLDVSTIFALIVALVLVLIFIFIMVNDTNPIHYSKRNSFVSELLRAAASSLLSFYNGISPMHLVIVLILLGANVAVLFFGISFFLPRSRFKKFWQTKSFARRLLINQFIGLNFLSLIIILTPHIPSLIELEDVSIDFMMELYSGIPPREEKISPFVLLDIDDETHQNWGQPLYTPRYKLKNLIDAAVQAEARLIVVDIDVSQSIGESTPDDLKLKEYLTNHVAICRENQLACPPIILVRAFSEFAYDFVKPFSDLAYDSVPAKPRIGFLEDVVAQSYPYLQWGSAQFFISNDMMRRWRLWEPTCQNEQPGVTPSIELLVMGMIRGCTEDIQKALRPFHPKNCETNEIVAPAFISFCGLTISTNHRSIQQRIMFRIPWLNDEIPPNNNNVPILTILSAQPYAESPLQASLKELNGGIVVIGGSYGRRGENDVHSTPIGDMPGALVIINAIHTLLQDMTIKPVSMWILFAIAIVFITVTTVFSYFSFGFLWKMLGVTIVFFILVMLLYVSVVIFEEGTWLNIVIPLLIVEIYLWIFKKKWRNKLLN